MARASLPFAGSLPSGSMPFAEPRSAAARWENRTVYSRAKPPPLELADLQEAAGAWPQPRAGTASRPRKSGSREIIPCPDRFWASLAQGKASTAQLPPGCDTRRCAALL